MSASTFDIGPLGTAAFPRVLAIDSEARIDSELERELSNFGFDVKVTSDARAVARAVAEWAPEAIVMDHRLSNVNAFALTESLRRITEVPILILNGLQEVEQKVRALSCGADDYFAEPCDCDEIAACIRARLRRPRMEKRDILRYADVTIDLSQHKVARGGTPIELSTREFDLLVTFARHPEQVFSRSQLLDLVWGIDSDVALTTVETYISYLRSKVDALGAPLLHTLRGAGYTMRLKR